MNLILSPVPKVLFFSRLQRRRLVHASSRHSTQLSSLMNRPERFNAKARRSSSTASSHKRGKQRRPKRQHVAETSPEILPRKSTEEKELGRREQLKEEVRVLYFLHATSVLPYVVTLAVSVKGIEQEEEEVGQIHCAQTISVPLKYSNFMPLFRKKS